MSQEIYTTKAPKVILPLQYGMAWRVSTYVTNFDTDNPVYWDAWTSNSEYISKEDGNTYQITLAGPKAYKLVGFVSVTESLDAEMARRFQWYNVTTGNLVGSEGGFHYKITGDASSGSGPAIAYVSIENESVFELRCTYDLGDVDYFSYGTMCEISSLQNLEIKEGE